MAPCFDFVDVRLLINIAETGSMSRGAERSFLSPPAATNRIRSLEESFGIRLLNRTSTGVTLTPAGEAFVMHGRALFAEVERLNDDLAGFAHGIRGQVRLWVNTTALSDLPEPLAAFMATHPDVNVELREKLSHEILQAIDEGSADIGIVAGTIGNERLELRPYRDDRLVLVAPLGHGFAARDSIDFVETLGSDHISLAESTAINKFVVQAASVCGVRLKMRVEVGSFEAVCRIVEAGVGVAIISEKAARRIERSVRVAVVPLRDEWAVRKLHICMREFAALPSFSRDLVEALAPSAAPVMALKQRA